MTQSPLESFREHGYATFPGILDADKVAELREVFTRVFAEPSDRPGDKPHMRNDALSQVPELRFLLQHRPFLDALETILGKDFAVLPEIALHDSFFGGWHKDTTSLEQAGHDFHREEGFRMVQCGIYFQSNDERYGGGLDIIPGSHERRDFGESVGDKLLRRVARRDANRLAIPNEPGDMIVFDMRADHRGTPPTVPEDQIPPEHRKFALFFVCSQRLEDAERYKAFIASRAGYEYLDGHEYPEDVRDRAAASQLTLV